MTSPFKLSPLSPATRVSVRSPRRLFAGTVLMAFGLSMCANAGAWWNSDWTNRKAITLDTTPAGADVPAALADVPVLVRLHTGNFGHFLTMLEAAADLRVIGGDDVTPLKYHIETYDPINEMALIWVKVPRLTPATKNESFWLYFGNTKAQTSVDAAGSYGVNDALVYHFDGANAMPQDVTSYANHAASSSAQANPASLIGPGLRFTGTSVVRINDSPSLQLSPETGWTVSAWVKIDGPQTDAYVFDRRDEQGRLTLAIDGTSAYARFSPGAAAASVPVPEVAAPSAAGPEVAAPSDSPATPATPIANGPLETPRNAALTPGTWHHLALVAGWGKVAVYLDGNEAASVPVTLTGLSGPLSIGAANAEEGHFFAGEMDELSISNVAREPHWLKFLARSQGTSALGVGYGGDESGDGDTAEEGGSYFAVILQNVTLDGWVVIVLCAILGAVSIVVIGLKGLTVRRVEYSNVAFLREFAQLSNEQQTGKVADDQNGDPSKHMLWRKEERFQDSPLYRLFDQSTHELLGRLGTAVGAQVSALEAKSINAIRASLDAVMVREQQKLNDNMVLLTLAISGGPFLGLLGTVIGVMITFAAIAATGDVNINAIAPGIAAALVATVAGLGVAIPALFGYNYLASRIKRVIADMRVFSDELVAKISETHGA